MLAMRSWAVSRTRQGLLAQKAPESTHDRWQGLAADADWLALAEGLAVMAATVFIAFGVSVAALLAYNAPLF
jgi:hypothetical protein